MRNIQINNVKNTHQTHAHVTSLLHTQVNWSEFRAFFHKRSLEIEKAFKAFDVNGDGVISKEELKSALFEAGIPADDDTVKKMVRLCVLCGCCGKKVSALLFSSATPASHAFALPFLHRSSLTNVFVFLTQHVHSLAAWMSMTLSLWTSWNSNALLRSCLSAWER